MQLNTVRRSLLVLFFLVVLVVQAPPILSAHPEPPDVWLPTPVGEEWVVIQGFYCGTHDSHRTLDIARVNGSTYGAPIRAAATGTIDVWAGSSGTLILDHGNNYYTQYTHLSQAVTTRVGTEVLQGETIGYIGGYEHLDFSLYYSPNGSYFTRQTEELDFRDGYSFHDTDGCNQHYGEVMVARDNPDTTPPTVTFTSDVPPEQWYCADERIEFTLADDRHVRGFRQAFDAEPTDDSPEFTDATAGYVNVSWAGEGWHDFAVRAWDTSNNQVVVPFGSFGYDTIPPTFAPPDSVPTTTYQRTDEGAVYVLWDDTHADDGNGSGIAGYYVYLGTDEHGTSQLFTDHNGALIKEVAPGCYVLRVQPKDVCRVGEWVTVQHVVVSDGSEKAMCGDDDDAREEQTDDDDDDNTGAVDIRASDITTATETIIQDITDDQPSQSFITD